MLKEIKTYYIRAYTLQEGEEVFTKYPVLWKVQPKNKEGCNINGYIKSRWGDKRPVSISVSVTETY